MNFFCNKWNIFLKCYLLFILRASTQVSMNRWGAERGRDRILSRLHAVGTEPHTGLEPTNCEIMTLAKIKSQMFNRLSHPCAPTSRIFQMRVGKLIFKKPDYDQHEILSRDIDLLCVNQLAQCLKQSRFSVTGTNSDSYIYLGPFKS